ncbi:uncharacterized protein LOC121729861 [Aricia agestis]|uniref:uncharacterized protein LOC121729861 n=1 Tax=Aricia agestis TaxID=91739 RepID=UPI001C20BB58|nr:uncharacterized protein LOC121729861 [Aricia agestis]XP_041974455.1 uncharacterized protein LOC121729861 [Aricia agestis]XP_041974456.1 uncharacterized protein LOC121729861 [Aricia agestis]XP_041974457.1 uncharacterized protein LOC121729861 [Aricia agestis]
MNPKIVVDHELFTTCRLCLEEKGKYQIVPVIQENIKFVFDIEVELNNGLPQLICVDCEKLLSNFVCTKQLFQEKQKRLQSRLQCETNKSEGSGISAAKPNEHKHRRRSQSREEESEEQERVVVTSSGKDTKLIIKKSKKTLNKGWRSSYVKQFGCRLCSEKFKKKDEIESHIRTHKRNVNNACFVRLEKFDDRPNVTGSTKFVVLYKDKIMRNKTQYYIVYSHKTNSHSDSEDEVLLPKRKFKRLKLDSESSSDTLVIDDSEEIKAEIKEETKQQTIKIHDRPPSSASESNSQPPQLNNIPSGNLIDTLITVCYNNLLKKMDSASIAKNAAEKSQLRHKVLSIGSKIINSNPINCIGILRYLEHRNLEVNFIMNESNDNYVRIRTKLKNKKERSNNEIEWKSLHSTSNSEPTTDFFDVLNKALRPEPFIEDKVTSSPRTLYGILLNANPVPNPKRLPKKNEESGLSIQISVESQNTSRGNGINTQSVSNTTSSADTSTADGSAQTALPRLKLKPVHELMAKRDEPGDSRYYSQPYHCFAGPAQSNRPAADAAGAPNMYVTNYNLANNGPNAPKYVHIAPTATMRPLSQIGNTMSNGVETNLVRKPDCMILDTVEFPNTSTPSPFMYFRNLLQFYNIRLLDSKTKLPTGYRCLINFKLSYVVGVSDQTVLFLSLFSNVQCFCIKVANSQGVEVDIMKMNANWQWEILKAFTGEIVPGLVANARSINMPMYDSVQKFICHLKSIKNVEVLS